MKCLPVNALRFVFATRDSFVAVVTTAIGFFAPPA
jgi:hypothetical protein